MNLSLLLLILATGFCFTDAGDQITSFGKPGPDDRLLERRRVAEMYSIFDSTTLTLFFPHVMKTYNVPITCIKVIDKINNGANRYAKIVSGGIGQRYAKIEFYSAIYRGFDYEVEIYGKKQ